MTARPAIGDLVPTYASSGGGLAGLDLAGSGYAVTGAAVMVVVASVLLVAAVLRGFSGLRDEPRQRRRSALFRQADQEKRFAEAAAVRRNQRTSEANAGSFFARRVVLPESAAVRDALKVLDVSRTATEKDIILAHRELMRRAHPDHGGSSEAAAALNNARTILLRHVRDRLPPNGEAGHRR